MKAFKPWAYQEKAMQWIANVKRCGLFLDMGLGKTVSTLTAVDKLMFEDYTVRTVLVIAPKRVAEDTWPDEVKKWTHLAHLKLSVVAGDVRKRKAALEKRADIYVIGRDNIHWLVDTLGKKWFFDVVVIDELSSFKSPDSRRFKYLKKVIGYPSRVIGLTGTPTPNGLLDLWGQIYLLDQGQRLGRTFSQYRTRFFTPSGYITTSSGQMKPSEYVPISGAEAKIWELISDICISMKSEDYLELPDFIPVIRKVRLSSLAMNKYKQLERDLLLPMETSDIVAGSAAVLANKLLQAASGAIYDEFNVAQTLHTDMVEALKEVVEEADSNILLFYGFRHDVELIQKAIPSARLLKTKEDFKDWNEKRVGLGLVHPASAGHGLNLQSGGHICVWYNVTWNLELYQQANKRLHRQGQERPVTAIHLIPENTIAEAVMQRLDKKTMTQDGLLEALSERKNKYYESVGV